jgi:hypothetical protein
MARIARRTRNWLVGVLVLAVATGTGWWVFAVPRYRVALPPVDATPTQVAMAYMRALDGDDRTTAEALSAPDYRSTTDHWLSMTEGLKHMTVLSSTQMPDKSEWWSPGEPWTEATDVSVEFDYRQAWWSSDESFTSGHHLWGYTLVRDKGRWLVDDCGMG